MDTQDLINSVLEWWEEHRHDTWGDLASAVRRNYGDDNVYDEAPEFVRIAQALKEQ